MGTVRATVDPRVATATELGGLLHRRLVGFAERGLLQPCWYPSCVKD